MNNKKKLINKYVIIRIHRMGKLLSGFSFPKIEKMQNLKNLLKILHFFNLKKRSFGTKKW